MFQIPSLSGCFSIDAYIALERNSKVIVGYRLGKREEGDTWGFAGQLKENTSGRFHLSTDGWKYYSLAMSCELGAPIDYAQIIKSFVNPPRDKGKYCPPQIVSVGRKGSCGNPNDKQTCTSHVERSNLTLRMSVRRWTRLTNAFSKSWEHHEAMLAIYIAFYNFVRVHMTLETTPAVASRLTDHAWTMEEMLTATAA